MSVLDAHLQEILKNVSLSLREANDVSKSTGTFLHPMSGETVFYLYQHHGVRVFIGEKVHRHFIQACV